MTDDWKHRAEARRQIELARRQAEIAKGQEIGARAFLKQAFDPDYVPNAGIDPETRRQRDEYREIVRRNLARSEGNA